MWFLLGIFAAFMQVSRRTAEKKLANGVDSLAMAWLQQTFALPFIIFSLFFAVFYWPSSLPLHYWGYMAQYVLFTSIDLFCYFKALSLADISYVAPLLTLTSVGNVIGSYFVLGQRPTTLGLIGVLGIVMGAYLVNKGKESDKLSHKTNQLALFYILLLVVVRGYASNIELFMTRVSNPTSFNFYSSVLTVPFVLLVASVLRRKKRTGDDVYWRTLKQSVIAHKWILVFIGLTYTVNMLATYQAKLIAPDAGYIGTIKNAQVIPMVFIGVIFFKEKVTKLQWYGVIVMILGLAALAIS